MKYLFKIGFSVFLFLVGFGVSPAIMGQTNATHNWQVGIGIGYTNYYGDLSNYRINGANELYKVYKFAQYNQYYQHQPSLSLLFQKKLTPTLGIMLQANYLQFGMSDRYRKNNGTLDTTATNYARSLNFRTTMGDVGFAFTFSPNNGKIGSETAFFYPSFYLGLGISGFDVKGDLYDANNKPYNYRLPGNINDGTYETNLRDQLTETDTKFRNVEPYVDLGLALNFRINALLSLAVQSDIKYSASDYLDGVSGKYKPGYATSVAAYPGYNVVNPATLKRGDDNGINDFYINNRIVLNITLSKKQPVKKFNSPVIYSLGTPYFKKYKPVDSTRKHVEINKDSIMRLKQDSINIALRDSISVMKSRVIQSSITPDSTVKTQLELINTELKNIKNILRDQQIRPKLQQLQYETDSIKYLRNRLIASRPVSKENNLQLRVYDLQLDSLHNEFERIRLQGYPLHPSDSLRINFQPYTPSRERVVQLDNYKQPAVTASSYDTTVRFIYLKKMDSIQRKLNELEKKSAESDSTNSLNDHGNQKKTADSLAAYKHALEMENQIKQEEDALIQSRQQLQLAQDSAAYYKKLKENSLSAVTTDTVAKKASWFQRYFGVGGKKKKTAPKTDTVYNADYANQQQYYEEQLNAMNKRIAGIEDNRNVLTEKKITYDRENKLRPDSADYVRNLSVVQQRIQRNSDSISLLRRQYQRSADSSAYYNKQMLEASEKANEESNRKWYQNLFISEKKRQSRIDAESDTRERNINQQQYYDNDMKNMQKRMDEMEIRNRELANSYQTLDAQRNQKTWNTPPVIPVNIYEGDNGNYNKKDKGAIDDLRAELQNLRNEMNYDARGNYILDTTLTGINQRSNALTPSPVVITDTSQVSLLRNELNQLRNQIDSLKTARPVTVPVPAPVVAEKPVKTEPKFDVTGFPVISVYFKMGSITLTGDELSKIAPFAQAANKNKEASIILKGFTDPTGNPAKNKIIANKRSNYIKNYLITKYKIADNRIVLEEPAAQEADSGKKANPLDRRVDLQFQ